MSSSRLSSNSASDVYILLQNSHELEIYEKLISDLQNTDHLEDQLVQLKLNEKLRDQDFSPEVSRAIISQAVLKKHAHKKFKDQASALFFTRDGLEQSSRYSSARYHAEYFKKFFETSGINRNKNSLDIVDVGSGIGADSLSFAHAGFNVTAVEKNLKVASIAKYNLRNFSSSRVIAKPAEDLESSFFDSSDALWFDPARRITSTSGSSRLWNPEDFSPPLTLITQLASQGKIMGVKLGPGIDHEILKSLTSSAEYVVETQFVSSGFDLIECILWFNMPRDSEGNFFHEPADRNVIKRSAIVLSEPQKYHDWSDFSELFSTTDFTTETTPLLTFDLLETVSKQKSKPDSSLAVLEPNPSIIRAGLISELAQQVTGKLIAPNIAYLIVTEDKLPPANSHLGRGYLIKNIFSYNLKNLKKYIKTHDIGIAEIKKRGMDLNPDQLRKRLGVKGENSATIIISRSQYSLKNPALESEEEPLSNEKRVAIIATAYR